MKIETSVTLDSELLAAVDVLSGNSSNRSSFIETALHAYIAQISRDERHAKDLEIINQHADQLNEEALDVLDYQVAF